MRTFWKAKKSITLRRIEKFLQKGHAQMSALVVTLSSIKNLEVEKKACTFPGLLQNQAKLCKLCKPLYFLNLNVESYIVQKTKVQIRY